jgi:polysaccharide biosynthesis/export protein
VADYNLHHKNGEQCRCLINVILVLLELHSSLSFGVMMSFFCKSLSHFLMLCVITLTSITSTFAQSTQDYELGPGDSIKVAVFLSPELSLETRLSEAGFVNLPMIGQVKLSGLTITNAETLISNKLRDGNFIQKAQVTISVATYRSQMVSVLGNFGKPGRYPLEVKGVRLSELLATVGGVTATGADTIILTRRNPNGTIEIKEIDLPSIYLNNKTDQDLLLQGGDTIYVHRQPNYYIYGQIGRPGIYTIERGMTVSQAIAKSGSYTLRSRESGVRLLRRDASGKIIESIPKMDDPIKADDQIFVRESLF